ncbi:MAG: transposase [Vicinamibacterales bacterium]
MTGDRLAVAADGRVVLRLRHPWADGTTHVAFEPTAFLERLAVLVPRPRINLLLYHGVLAAHAAWRADAVGAGVGWRRGSGRCGIGQCRRNVARSGRTTLGGPDAAGSRL